MHVAWYAVWKNRDSIEYTEDNKRCHALRASLLQEELARKIGALVGGVMLTALLFELLDAKFGDIKTWVKGKLKDTRFISKINTTVENTITKVFSKADQFALLSGKVEKVLESLKANLSEEAFEYLAYNLKKDQISDLMEAVRKLEKELGSTEIKLSEAQVKKLLEGLKDGKGVDSMVAELKTWCENAVNPADLGSKLDYLFGKATGNKHNIERSKAMQTELQKIGIHDTPSAREYLTKHLNDVLNDSTNISNVETRSYIAKELPGSPLVEYQATTRESLLMGPGGAVKMESVWDNNRLLTVIIKGGN